MFFFLFTTCLWWQVTGSDFLTVGSLWFFHARLLRSGLLLRKPIEPMLGQSSASRKHKVSQNSWETSKHQFLNPWILMPTNQLTILCTPKKTHPCHPCHHAADVGSSGFSLVNSWSSISKCSRSTWNEKTDVQVFQLQRICRHLCRAFLPFQFIKQCSQLLLPQRRASNGWFLKKYSQFNVNRSRCTCSIMWYNIQYSIYYPSTSIHHNSQFIYCYHLCFICSFDSFSRSFSSFSFVSWRNGSTRVLEHVPFASQIEAKPPATRRLAEGLSTLPSPFGPPRLFPDSWNEKKKQKRSGLAKLILNFSKILEVWWGWMFATVRTHFPQWWLLSLAKTMPRFDCMVLTVKPVSVVNVIITLKPANLVSPKSIHMAHVARNLQMFENFMARQPILKFCIFIFQSFQTVLSVIENA